VKKECKVIFKENKHTPWPESESELHLPRDRRLSAKSMPTFADRSVSRGQRGGFPTAVISIFYTKPLLFFQVAPQLLSRG
jgi:hypothetical protein